jgi:hypothetical protein
MRQRILDRNAEADAKRAKAATTAAPEGVSAVDHAHALIDSARRDPSNRDVAAQALDAAARAGPVDREPCARQSAGSVGGRSVAAPMILTAAATLDAMDRISCHLVDSVER